MDIGWWVNAAVWIALGFVVWRYMMDIAKRIDAHIDDHKALKGRVSELEAAVDDLSAAVRRGGYR
jgi:hypothetical protein